jgi:hypothetical protein
MPDKAYPQNPRDLLPAEQVLLGATRLWAGKSRMPKHAFDAVQNYYGMFDIKDAAKSHVAILSNSAAAGRRALTINVLCNPNLTLDESHIVHAVAYTQRGDIDRASATLSNWLPLEAVRLTMPAMSALADNLIAKRLVAPLRPWSCAPDLRGFMHHGTIVEELSSLAH